jgi:hypothetical protein
MGDEPGRGDELGRRLAALPQLARVQTLRLDRGVTMDADWSPQALVPLLTTSPHWRQLRGLDVVSTSLDDHTAARVAGTPNLPLLTSLFLAGTLGDETLATLGRNAALTRLALHDVQASPDAALLLTRAVCWSRLTHFHWRPTLGAEAPTALLLSNLEGSLVEYLSLAGLLSLLENHQPSWLRLWRRLKGVALYDVVLNEALLRRVARELPSSGLVELHLHGCGLGADGAAELAGCEALSNLRTLSISNDFLGDAGMQALAESPHLRQLTTLTLNRICDGRYGPAPVTADGVAALVRSPVARRLRRLDLKGNHLQDDDVEPLCDATGLEDLTALEISRATVRWDSVSEAMLRRVSSNPALPHLSLAFLEGKWLALDCGAVREFPRGISPLWPFDRWAPWEVTPPGG